MKKINLLVHANAKKELSHEMFLKYCAHEVGTNYEYNSSDEDALLSLVDYIQKESSQNYEFFSDFYYGYKIPQISKELDILKISDVSIVNID